MRITIGSKDVLWLLPTVSVFIFVRWIMTEHYGFIFATLASLLTYFAVKLYFNNEEKTAILMRVPLITGRKNILKVVPYVCALFSIFVLLVDPISNSYVDWLHVPLVNYLRAIGAFLITSYLPGYFALVVLGLEKNVNRLEKITYSYLLSIFIAVTITYCFSIHVLQVFSTLPLVIITAGLMVASAFKSWLNPLAENNQSRKQGSMAFSVNRIAILFLTILFANAGLWAILSNNYSLIVGDEWAHHGWSIMITREVFPKGFPIFHLYLATNFDLSGFPPINMHTFLAFPTITMLIASFYLMAYTLFKDAKKSTLTTTLFTIFSGFGGFLAVYNYAAVNIPSEPSRQALLNEINLQSMLDTRYLYSSPFWFVESTLVFISTFILLQFLYKEKIPNRVFLILIPVTIFVGYSNRPEIIIFFIVLLLSSLLFHEKAHKTRLKKLSLASILGLILSCSYISLGGDIWRSDFIYELFLMATLAAMAIVAFLISSSNLSVRILSLGKVRCDAIFLPLFYLVGLSFVVWNEMRLEIQNNFNAIYIRGLIPWYSYPLLLGISGIIVVVGTYFIDTYSEKDKKTLKLLLLSALSFIFLGRTLTFFNSCGESYGESPLPFWEIRTAYWVRIFLTITAAYVIIQILPKIRYKWLSNIRAVPCRRMSLKVVALGCIITLVIIAGISSTLIKIDYWSRYANFGTAGGGKTTVSMEELEAIDYLRLNSKPYGQVISLTDPSWDPIKGFGGIPNVFYRPFIFFSSTQPEFVLQTTSTQEFIYLAQRDYYSLQKKYEDGFLARYIMPYLPVAFNNSEVVIYEVPEMSLPSDNSELALIRLHSMPSAQYVFPTTLLATSGFDYTIVSDRDPNRFNYRTLILPFDPSENPRGYVECIENGSQVMVLGDSNLGFFASSMNLDFNGETIIDGVRAKNFTIATPPTSIPVLYPKSPNVKPIANYTIGDAPASAFALCKDIGLGKLIYVNFEPILAIINNAPVDVKWSLLSQIGLLVGELLDARTSIYSSDQNWKYEVIEGIKLNGLVKINSPHPPFPLTNIEARYLDFSSARYRVVLRDENVEFEPAIMSNVTILNFTVHGSINSTLITTYTESLPFGYGHYLALDFTEGVEWILELGDNSSMTIEMVGDNLSAYNIQVHEGTIRIRSTKATLFVRTPAIHVQGEILFDRAYVGWIGSSHPVKSEGYPLKIQGNGSFNVECADANTVLISNLKFDGTGTVYSSSIPRWNEWDIPWFRILISPYHLLLISATLTLVFSRRKLKTRKIKLKFSWK